MGIVSGGGGSGNTTAQVVASGKVLPAADPTGVTVNTTTYPNQVTSVGNMTTLVFPTNTAALAFAVAGDAFPRYVFAASGSDGIYMGDGTFDPYNAGGSLKMSASLITLAPSSTGKVRVGKSIDLSSGGTPLAGGDATPLVAVSPVFSITAGALPTMQFVSGAAQQNATVGDVEMHTPVTFNPSAGAAATCKVELSPDNVTFSTLAIWTEPVGVVFDGTIHDVPVRVPSGWYLKLTVVNAVLGLTTYY